MRVFTAAGGIIKERLLSTARQAGPSALSRYSLDELAGDYAITPIKLPDDIELTYLSIETLPFNWDASEPTDETRKIGTDWANSLTTTVLVVSSVVIASEYNYLLNPRHPDFSKVLFLGPEPFHFDVRLGRAWLKK